MVHEFGSSKAINQIISEKGTTKIRGRQGINRRKSEFSQQYIFATLDGDVIRELVKRDSSLPKVELKGETKSREQWVHGRSIASGQISKLMR